MGSTLWIAGLAALSAILGLRWWWANQRLMARLFGPSGHLEYIHRRWVMQGTINDLQARYTTGGMGRYKALTYLWMPFPIRQSGVILEDRSDTSAAIPADLIDALRAADGFRRLDLIGPGEINVSALGRISWLAAGEGLLLQRFTRHGADPDFVRRDVQRLAEIADCVR